MLLLLLVAMMGDLWRRAALEPEWIETAGKITDARVEYVHYNAEPDAKKSHVDYEYYVGTATFHGTWEGLWPRVHSPNAVPDGRVEDWLKPGRDLVVFFDPANIHRSRLHDAGRDRAVLYMLLTFGSILLLVVYCVKFYPLWKRRRRT